MLTWKRERVSNFKEDFARAYAVTLASLDGHVYEQARFFERLADTGIVQDVPDEGDAEKRDKARAKKWDTYNNKIREYGFGFVESRKGGPSIWRASEMAHALHSRRLSYREFVALQMTRTQVPTPVLPVRDPYKTEMQLGVWERPLRVTLQALDDLRSQGTATYLSEEEFSQLQRVDTPSGLTPVIADVISVRAGNAPSSDWLPRNGDVDIWFNELSFTGYVRLLRVTGQGLPGAALVPRWARLREAHAVDDALPMKGYSDAIEVNAFHDEFSSVPSTDVLALLRGAPDVVVLDIPGDATFDLATNTLKGPFSVVGGLDDDDRFIVRGSGVDAGESSTVFGVEESAEKSSSADVEVIGEAKQRRMDGQPIEI